jgi:aspartate kinase
MALIVHKYGGTSMGSTERIRNVAKRVAKWARAGHQMVVVPSAMSGETNRLLGLAKELAPTKTNEAYARELDMLAATGEQASSALLAIALQAEGMESVSYAGWQVPIVRTVPTPRPALNPLTTPKCGLIWQRGGW